MTLRITVCDRYVDLDKRGVAGWGHYLMGRWRLLAVEVER